LTADPNALDRQTIEASLSSAVAAVVVHLLQSAGRTLASDNTPAKRLIDQAIVLLSHTPADAPEQRRGRTSCNGLAPWQVRRVSEFVDKNLASALPMARLADTVNLSPSHFSHAFRRHLGISPHSYVLRKRVEKAQQLMLTTNEPLAQIAMSCGLTSQSHLCQVFRRVVGSSPGSWRRLYQMRNRDGFAASASRIRFRGRQADSGHLALPLSTRDRRTAAHPQGRIRQALTLEERTRIVLRGASKEP
jgi:transcriptional regulator GlxA family with amidase domain